MRTADGLPETSMKLYHRDWHIIPSEDKSNSFHLKNKAGQLLCTLVFSKKCNASFLNLIAAAPELQDIAEMYHDHMLGGQMQRSMIFSMVREILGRLQ